MKNLIFINIQITTNLYDQCATEVEKHRFLGSCYEEETFKLSSTKQPLNMLKLCCEYSVNQRSERYNWGE